MQDREEALQVQSWESGKGTMNEEEIGENLYVMLQEKS